MVPSRSIDAPTRANLLVATERAAVDSLRDELSTSGLATQFLDTLADLPERLQEFQPSFVLVDGSICPPDPAPLADAVAMAPSTVWMLLLPTATGRWVSIADRCGVDAIFPAPLQRVALDRVLTDTTNGSTGACPFALPLLVDQDERMREVWRMVALASRADASVLVNGETGVGKEVVARALHRFSHRRHQPFVAVNCAALPETLLESELFGHEKGAFTGATAQRKGRFELADGGTLFLDEVGDLPLSLQVKLLRVLQERCFERIGGTRTISVDVRVVSATHRDLTDEIQRGRFRADLYYRIRVLGISVPSLRMRKEDVLSLWQHFIEQGATEEGRASPETTMAARRRLLRHHWPGNVRELQNAAQHALMVAGARPILPADLPELTAERASQDSTDSLVGMTLEQIERQAILDTYAALGTVKAAAEALGVSERKLHYRLKRYRQEGSIKACLRIGRAKRSSPVEQDEHEPQILLVEDDDELRWVLHDFLRCEGYEVVPVQDGRSLLEHLGAGVLFGGRSEPDVIITDIRMPFLTGIQLLQQVQERGWKTPVVMISAFGDDDLKRRALSLGAAAFLDKPIDTDALLRVLRAVVVQELEPGEPREGSAAH